MTAQPRNERPATGIGGRDFLGHPRGLAVLFATESWERFSYFGNAALVVLYMVKYLLEPGRVEAVLGFGAVKAALEFLFGRLDPQPLASQIFGFYTGLAYFMPVLGGLIADRLLGQRRTVIIGGVLMAIGHFMMAFETLFLLALLMLILGIGAFKPNISTQVGALYPPADTRRDRAYSIFYLGINIGAFLAPLVCGTLAVQYGWHAGFGAAGVGMLVSLGIYLGGRHTLPPDALPRAETVITEKKPLDSGERRAVRTVIGVCALVTLFWAAYDQQGNTLLLWTEDFTDRSIDLLFWRGEVPSTWFLALNPLMIFIFTPLIVRLWALAGPARHRAVADQQNGVRLSLRRAGQCGDGGGGMDRRRQGEPVVAGRLFRHRHHRRAPPCAGRARHGLENGAHPHALDDDGGVVCGHVAGRHSRRLPRRFLEQHGQAGFFPDDRIGRGARKRRHLGHEPCGREPVRRRRSEANIGLPVIARRSPALGSMRPGIAAVEGEIVGVGHDAAGRRSGMKDLVGDAVALAVRGRFVEGVEAQMHLLAHVARAGPAHQRLDLARLFGLVIEHPFLGLAGAGLHRSLCGLVDAGRHDLSLALTVVMPRHWSGQQDLNLRPGVPKTPALPGCAMPRLPPSLDTRFGLGQQATASRPVRRPNSA